MQSYQELAKLFLTCEDKEYSKFSGLVAGFVKDSNAAAQVTLQTTMSPGDAMSPKDFNIARTLTFYQVAGLEATLAFVENAPNAKNIAKEISAGIALKCLHSMKAATKVKVNHGIVV